jgi:hypothetical protein
VDELVWRNRCSLDKGVQTSRGGELQSGDYFITVGRGKTACSPSLGLNGQGHPWTHSRTAYGSVICLYGNRTSTSGKPQRTACLRLHGFVNTEGSAVLERVEKSSGCGPLRRSLILTDLSPASCITSPNFGYEMPSIAIQTHVETSKTTHVSLQRGVFFDRRYKPTAERVFA